MSTQVDVLAQHRHSRVWQRRLRPRLRFARDSVRVNFAGLVTAVTIAGIAQVVFWRNVPWGIFLPPVVVGGLFLGPKRLLLGYVYLGAWVVYAGATLAGRKPAYWGSTIVLAVTMLLMFRVSKLRSRLGLQGLRGENLLLDLRDRLRSEGKLPPLPDGWHGEAVLESAYGEGFSGDFIVATKTNGGSRLEIVIVDVSGKGATAGSRSLQLSGAFGGLLGSMEPAGFLPAANGYLLRQDWDEGFATAAHAVIDLETGQFSVGSAGHPPAIKFWAGSSRWLPLGAEGGPILGVLDEPPFPREQGVLGRGDALLLYTDGVVETRARDLRDGIDRMLGLAERSMQHGFHGLAARVIQHAGAGESDDRAVVMLWRR